MIIMKKIKKFFICALTVCLVFSGCSKGNDEADTETVRVTESEASSTASVSNETDVFTGEITSITEVTQSDVKTDADTTAAGNTVTETDVSTAAAKTTVEETTVPTRQTDTTAADESDNKPVPADRIQDIIDNMSLEEKVGQIILVRYSEETASMASQYHFGGYTLYARDFENETPDSIQAKLEKIRSNSHLPPFFAADEEGGDVIRISKYTAFSSSPLPAVGSDEAKSDIKAFAEKMSEVLKKGGINLNLAPVADVAESENDYIYGRTCREDYEKTGEIIGELVKELNGRNIISCLKHFPGYGSNVDTHTGIALDSRTEESFESKDFIPFKAGIKANVPMIMVNHNIVAAYNDKVPASLAPEIHQVLRDMGFKGVIVTDDLGMGAIAQYSESPYADAVLAGNDLLCTSDGARCYETVYQAVKDGIISEEQLDKSVYRVLKLKTDYGILER